MLKTSPNPGARKHFEITSFTNFKSDSNINNVTTFTKKNIRLEKNEVELLLKTAMKNFGMIFCN